MRSHLIRLLGSFAASLALVISLPASEPAIIAKARAYVGSESALNAIKSLHFIGTVVSPDPTDATKQTRASIDIIVQKPDQQRVVAKSDRGMETTVVDGYEGWQRFQDAANPKNQRLTVLKPDAVKRLRAQVWENLYFFRSLAQSGGRMEDMGAKKVDGVDCQKIAFIHPPNVVFIRYFEVSTGRLILTETDDGGSTREEGERVINGVKFPKSMKMTVKGPKGQPQEVNISFDTITVNEVFPAAVFRMPSPGSE